MQRRVRRGSAYVSPVISSSSEDEVPLHPLARRRRTAVSSPSSSSSSSDSNISGDDADDTDVEEFVDRRRSSAKLDRLRRIFLNQPPKAKRTFRRKADKETHETHSTTTSNSSGDNNAVEAPAMTLTIGHHVQALRDHVSRLTRLHNAHAPQWQATLTQAIEELTFVKQQEERALQSHVQLLQESYALRLEVFEQQYRAKVAEIREAMRSEMATQRQQSEAAVVAMAERLQQQTLELFQADETPSLPEVLKEPVPRLVKTTAFLDRQRAREAARRRSAAKTHAPSVPVETAPAVVLSPVAKERAKLQRLQEKLASFSPETVDRVVRTADQQERERRGRVGGREAPPLAAVADASLRPTPLSPLRRRQSFWDCGISKEDPDGHDAHVAPTPATQRLSRRFLLPEEERELRALRNSIGLAKDWMETHATRA